jgi:hypothetical protein
MGRFGIPSASVSTLANTMNSEVQMVTVGVPRFSSSMESRTLHEVHAPQSPCAVITMPHLEESSSSKSCGALEQLITVKLVMFLGNKEDNAYSMRPLTKCNQAFSEVKIRTILAF